MTDVTALGIDLGTTYSVVAQVNEAGMPLVLPTAEGPPTTPSVVLFDAGHAVVGAIARESLASEPESVVQLVKRHMGSAWTFDYQGVSYRPEHISALILRKLVQDAQLLAGPVSQAVITVPAYFNDAMRAATRRAGELAGIEVLGLLSEPTAAALAFGYDRRPEGTTGVVIDLGGGTFDVTVMDYDGQNLNVRATGGDAYLGGANFDKVIFDYLVEQFEATHGLDINDPDALSLAECTQISQDWLHRSARIKHDLTSRERSTAALQAAGLTLRVEVRRDVFLDRSSVLLAEMKEKMADVLTAAGAAPRQVGIVLAVGGSTRIPAVRELVKDMFGQLPETSVRPDEAVALGAALFAAQRQMELGGALVMADDAREYLEGVQVNDVAAHSLGVSVFDPRRPGRPVMARLLPRNTALPVEAARSFYTMRPGEAKIIIPVLEGEEPDPDLCRRIGEVIIEGLPPGRPERQQVDVVMRLDRDGILKLSATDVASGAAAATTIIHTDQTEPVDTAADHAARNILIE
ncbi:MAG TPA: Hsp70 family protein [Streptosporangiaceae bacterium]